MPPYRKYRTHNEIDAQAAHRAPITVFIIHSWRHHHCNDSEQAIQCRVDNNKDLFPPYSFPGQERREYHLSSLLSPFCIIPLFAPVSPSQSRCILCHDTISSHSFSLSFSRSSSDYTIHLFQPYPPVPTTSTTNILDPSSIKNPSKKKL